MNLALVFIIGIVLGGALGYLLAWALSKSRTAETLGRMRALESERKQFEERIAQMDGRLDELNAQLKMEAEKRAFAEASLAHEKEVTQKQLSLLEDARKQLEDAFKALAPEALRANSEAFLQLAKETLETFHTRAKGDLTEREKAIENLLTPIKSALEKFEKQTAELEKSREGAYRGLQEQVRALLETGQSLQKETGRLVSALSAPQVRGHWGEMTLRRVVELAGMSEHVDFVEQESVDSEKGRLRPDMIINLPAGRRIIVDAKAPLKAYLEAVEILDEEQKRAKFVEYARQVKTRVQELSKKEYWEQWPEVPEFVVLSLPGEQFLGTALQEDPSLLEEAFEKKVVPATPTTLIAVLKAVAYGWRQEALAKDAQQISELGNQLYERLLAFVEHFSELGRSLDRSFQAYNKAVRSFESRLLVSARRFKELGVSTKELPELQPVDHAPGQILPLGFTVGEGEVNSPHG